ncbi:MAG: hypothetical protein FJ100_22465 [Deltaproteobacteria bacterium]|nr:hypothetical protein [Deltaproteobacteria bacterium]
MTNLSTLWADGAFVQLAAGPAAHVIAVADWHQKTAALTPEVDVDRATARALSLAGVSLAVATRTNWCSRLQGHPDLFEIRINGVRYYGGNAGPAGAGVPVLLVLVLAGAEQKGGHRGADPAQIAAAQAAVAEARNRLAAANVINLSDRRRQRR